MNHTARLRSTTPEKQSKRIEMAPGSSRLLVAVAALLHAAAAAAGNGGPLTRYDRVFSFGDSLTDTGNALHLSATAGGPASRPPYGETFFRRPTGRASDGRLVIDFLGEHHQPTGGRPPHTRPSHTPTPFISM
jgi:phospholipase/lecithinase/hemolysin